MELVRENKKCVFIFQIDENVKFVPTDKIIGLLPIVKIWSLFQYIWIFLQHKLFQNIKMWNFFGKI